MQAALETTHVTPAELVERARGLVPVLRDRAAKAKMLRRVPDETMADLHDAGFFRIVRPHRYGGYELNPSLIYDLQLELGRGCGSTAWVYGVLNVHSWQLALFEKEAQDEVWSAKPDTLISSSYMPVGKATRVPGGVRLRGRWSFSSGCDHSDWVMLGGFVPPEKEGGAPEMRTFLLPMKDCTIVDTWYVSGLAASGSKDIVVEDAFVPDHRMHKFADGFRQSSPGNAVNPSPVYRFPFGQIHVRSVSTPALGIALGALDDYVELARSLGLEAFEEAGNALENAKAAAADAASLVDRELLTLHRNFDEMTKLLESGTPIPLERRARFRNDSARAVSTAVAIVDDLFTAAGRHAIRDGHPLNRAFQDVHAIRAHHANGPDKPAQNFGGITLGQKNVDYFL